MSYLTIIQPDETFPYIPNLQDGGPSDSLLTLRVLGDSTVRALRKKHTRHEWQNGQRVQNLDSGELANDMLDTAIVAWRGIKDSQGRDLPCERTFKLLLPDRVQLEVIKLCAGKEAGSVVATGAEVGGDEGKAD